MNAEAVRRLDQSFSDQDFAFKALEMAVQCAIHRAPVTKDMDVLQVAERFHAFLTGQETASDDPPHPAQP